MNKLRVSSSPHIRTKNETPRVMLDVIIALLPTTIAGVIIFGLRALLVIATCVLSSVVAEYVFNIITKKQQTIFDMSAVVTGLILALNLHAQAPIWQCVIAGFAKLQPRPPKRHLTTTIANTEPITHCHIGA